MATVAIISDRERSENMIHTRKPINLRSSHVHTVDVDIYTGLCGNALFFHPRLIVVTFSRECTLQHVHFACVFSQRSYVAVIDRSMCRVSAIIDIITYPIRFSRLSTKTPLHLLKTSMYQRNNPTTETRILIFTKTTVFQSQERSRISYAIEKIGYKFKNLEELPIMIFDDVFDRKSTWTTSIRVLSRVQSSSIIQKIPFITVREAMFNIWVFKCITSLQYAVCIVISYIITIFMRNCQRFTIKESAISDEMHRTIIILGNYITLFVLFHLLHSPCIFTPTTACNKYDR